MAGIFSSIEVSGSGMSLQRRKMNVVSQNIANAETTKTEEGGPYRRRRLDVSADDEKLPFKTILEGSKNGLLLTNKGHLPEIPVAPGNYETVAVAKGEEVQADEDAYRLIYDPTHPDADADGYVKMPDIELINEMVDMMSANRAYEANALSISASKEMLKNALDI
jgi:flagellar basal-body rod protein FlgC